MTAENFAAALPFAVLAACLFRARLLALALVPPCALILARSLELVDTSSASHPLRFFVPIASMSLAMWAAWIYRLRLQHIRSPEFAMYGYAEWIERAHYAAVEVRALIASILVFASGCADIPALLAWRLPGEWVLVPLQIAVCLVILVVLLAPERWVMKWT